MKITTVKTIEDDCMEDASEAWRLSRNHDVKTPWRDIFTIDCPVTEFPQAFLYFDKFTLLDREIFSSNRAHVMWARTSFVDDPLKFTVPDDVEFSEAWLEGLRKDMAEEKAAGMHSDQWRQHLPLLSETSFSMRVSFRDLMKYHAYFEYLATRSEALKWHFLNVAEEIQWVAMAMLGGSDASLDLFERAKASMSTAKFLNEGTVPHQFLKTEGRNLVVLNVVVPFWIRAHFARHRPITIADDLFRVATNPNVARATIEAPIGMEIAATNDVWKALLSKRSCWMTQSTLSGRRDPWQQIIEAFGVTEQTLPCSAGSCPFRRDAELRYTDEDPGCPCPMHMKLYGMDPEPWRGQLAQAYPSRPEFWRSVI